MANFVQLPCDKAAIRAKAAVTPCDKPSAKWILAATILGSSMAFIDGTVVNIALPALQHSLNATVVDMQWVVEAYSLPLAALLLVGGFLGDRYGRRSIFLIGIGVFSLASAWAGSAVNIHQLIFARVLQGVGGALLIPGSLAIIGASFRGQDRGRAIGTWSGFTAITTAIGPVLGGWLIQNISWRAVFFLNLPLAILVIAISVRRVPESRGENRSEQLDWLGASLNTIGLGCLVYGLLESSRSDVNGATVAVAVTGGVICLAIFLAAERRTQNPMLPLVLFRSRNFTGANLVTLLLYAALAGTFFFLPLNLIEVQRYSPTAAGAALLPFILTMFLLSRWSGGLVAVYGSKVPLSVGPLIAASGFLLFALPDSHAKYWVHFFPAAIVLGLGMAVSVAPLTTTVLNAIPETRVGIASGIDNAISRAAGVLAIAVFGTVVVHVFNHCLDVRLGSLGLPEEVKHSLQIQQLKLASTEVPEQTPVSLRQDLREAINDAFVNGCRTVMLVGGMMAAASAIVSLIVLHDSRPVHQPDQ